MSFNFLGPDHTTDAAFDDPQPGHTFTEMCSYWVFVLWRKDDEVVWMTATGGQTVPRDGALHAGTVDDFKAAFSYSKIDGYCVGALKTKRNVDGWLEHAVALRAGAAA